MRVSMSFLQSAIKYILVAALAYYLSVLTWNWTFSPKINQVNYALLYRLPGFEGHQSSGSWALFDHIEQSDKSLGKRGTFDPERFGIKLLGIIKLKVKGVAIFLVRSETKVVGLNELVTANIKLVQLEQHHAVLTDGTQDAIVALEKDRKALLIPDTSAEALTNKKPVVQPPESQSSGIIATATDHNTRQKLQKLKQDIKQAPFKAASMVNFRPVMKQGKIEGIEVNPKSDPVLFKSLGFEPKDVILSVDDLPMEQLMNDPTQWASLLNASSLSFRIKRNNQVIDYKFAW